MVIWEKYWPIIGLALIVFVIMLTVTIFRIIAYIREQKRRELQKLAAAKREAEDEVLDDYDESEKEALKNEILAKFNIELKRNRNELKREVTKDILYTQSRQYEKLKKAAIIKIIRKALYEFRSRFFKNLQQVMIAKAQKKKGNKTRLSRVQESAIKDAEKEIQKREEQKEQREQERNTERKQSEKDRIAKEEQRQQEQEKEIARLKEEETRARNEKERERLQQERLEKEQRLNQQKEQQAQQNNKQQAQQAGRAQQAASNSGRSGGR